MIIIKMFSYTKPDRDDDFIYYIAFWINSLCDFLYLFRFITNIRMHGVNETTGEVILLLF